jgi:hypothetical protein
VITFSNADKLAPALVKAIGELTDPHKAGKVAAGQRRYSYMTLPDLLTEVRAVFAANGLAVLQSVEVGDGYASVTTTIVHESGQMLVTAPLNLRTSPDAQSVGSAVTYGRRYALAALVGLAGSEDDDGERASRPVERVTQRASDPDPWAQPRPAVDAHTQEVAGRTDAPRAEPITPGALGDGVSRTRAASDKSVKMMWALLRATGMTDEQVKLWVGTVLTLGTNDWHTSDLTQAQVSAVIDRLKGSEQ